MAKKAYKIPHGLDKSRLDMEIAFRSNNGVGLRPLPLKFILAVLVAFLLGVGILTMSPVKDAGIPFMILFGFFWVGASIYLLKLDKTGEMAFMKIPVAIRYNSPNAKRVKTRMPDEAGPFIGASNIESADEKRGLIKFADGDVGFAYRVVGSASVLLFDEDKEAIIDRVDAFYRKMRTEYELIFITAKEPQNVMRQLSACDERIAMLSRDPANAELLAIEQMRRDQLEHAVGQDYRSIHQYLIIKADSEEALDVGRNLLRTEVEGSLLMFKRCVALFDDELRALIASTFSMAETQVFTESSVEEG